jgi:hypothetical protein
MWQYFHLFFFSGSIGVWITLARQVLYSLSHAFSPFCQVILEIGFGFLLRLAWSAFFLFYASLHSIQIYTTIPSYLVGMDSQELFVQIGLEPWPS